MLLEGKTAIVYGGSGAVGGAVGKAFAREGARVFLSARNAEGLEGVAAEIRAAGGRAEIGLVDAKDRASVEAHLASVVEKAGPVRVMFNAIDWGDTQGEVLTGMPFERMFGAVEGALKTYFETGTALARHMAGNGGGVIIGMTANAAREAFSHVGGFGIACAAVEHFLRQLGRENGQYGVRCVWVRSPGSPDTPGVRSAWQLRANEQGVSFEEVAREFGRHTPLGQVTPVSQVADAAVLLASDLAAALTMTVANATGGAQVD